MKDVEGVADATIAQISSPGAVWKVARHWLRRSGIVAQLVSLALILAAFALCTQGTNLSWANVQVVLSLAAIPAILAIGLHLTIVIGGMTLAGGRGSILGVLGGSLIIGILNNIMTLIGIGTFSQDMVRGAIFIIVVGINAISLRSLGRDDA